MNYLIKLYKFIVGQINKNLRDMRIMVFALGGSLQWKMFLIEVHVKKLK